MAKTFNPFGAESWLFQDNYVNTKADDALVHCVDRLSADLILTMQDSKSLFSMHQEFQLPAPSQDYRNSKFIQNKFSTTRVNSVIDISQLKESYLFASSWFDAS